ncbi:MAG: DHH family phosphoesterase, partial [Negativicutes bacterium]|nr:DHH family phosphoesterase [Negativicutes bacterium]
IYHQHPDGDCLGSTVALAQMLRQAGATVQIVDDERIIPRLLQPLLEGIEQLSSKAIEKVGVLILVDCCEPKRTPTFWQKLLDLSESILVIDHHQTAWDCEYDGWINVRAAATAEMLTELLLLQPEWQNENIRRSLFVGLAADTGFFHYANTTAATFQAAAVLRQNPNSIYQRYFSNYTLPEVRAFAVALQRLLSEEGVLTSYFNYDEMQQLQDSDIISEVMEMLQRVDSCRIVAFMKEIDHDIWKISLRQRDSEYDLAAFAAARGGGGHRQAAAFQKSGSLQEVQQQLRSEWKEVR